MSVSVTPSELALLRESGLDPVDNCGFGVELRGSAAWQAARRLVDRELGWIEGGAPNGSDLPGLFFANPDGVDWGRDDG